MTLSAKVDTLSRRVDGEDKPLLNVGLYNELAADAGLHTVTAQALHHGIRRPYWSEIHNRHRSPSFRLARKVAGQLGVSTDELWGPEPTQ